METTQNKSIAPFAKVLYTLFLLFSGYQILMQHSYVDAAASLGIALAFDPFTPEQPWNERPLWQKVWLFVHLALVGLLFGLGLGLDAI